MHGLQLSCIHVSNITVVPTRFGIGKRGLLMSVIKEITKVVLSKQSVL